jgi:hypothetical protein
MEDTDEAVADLAEGGVVAELDLDLAGF